MSNGQAIGNAMEAVRTSLGMSQRDVEQVTGIPRDTFRRWAQGTREPTPRMIGVWLGGMQSVVRRRAPELDYMLDPMRSALGRDVGDGSDAAAAVTLEGVPGSDEVSGRYGVRMPDGRIAICEDREIVPGHLHAARWESASGTMAGIYRVTPTKKTQYAMTQDHAPGNVLLVRTDQVRRCDPVVALVQYLLPEKRT